MIEPHTRDTGLPPYAWHPYNLTQGEPEWYGERLLYDLTASEVPTVLGLNKYKTPLRLFHEKRGEMKAENSDDKPAVIWGKEHEREGRRCARDFLDRDYVTTGLWPWRAAGTYLHDPTWKLAGSPDGLVLDGQGTVSEVLEVKCPFTNRTVLDMPDPGHVAQLVTIMAVTKSPARDHKPEGTLFYWTPTGCRAYRIREPVPDFWEDNVLPEIDEFVRKVRSGKCGKTTEDYRKKWRSLMMSCVRGILYRH
jgi:hypothetical protein